ncbi:hypothetical protein Emag_007109 [Eimeria magna]
MKDTEVERRVPQVRRPGRAWRACEAKKFLALRILGLGVLEGEVFNSGRQRDTAPAMHDLGWDVIRQLRHGGRGAVVIGIGETDLDIDFVIGAAGSGPDRCASGVDRGAHVAQAVPQEAHPPNRTGGELVQNDRLLRGSWGNGGPRQAIDMFLLGTRAVYDLEPEFLQAQSPALKAPTLRAVVADILEGGVVRTDANLDGVNVVAERL